MYSPEEPSLTSICLSTESHLSSAHTNESSPGEYTMCTNLQEDASQALSVPRDVVVDQAALLALGPAGNALLREAGVHDRGAPASPVHQDLRARVPVPPAGQPLGRRMAQTSISTIRANVVVVSHAK